MSTDAIFSKIVELLDDKFGIEADEVNRDTTFEDLDLDSLDLVEFSMAVEDELDVKIEDEEAADLKTVGDAVALIEEKQKA